MPRGSVNSQRRHERRTWMKEDAEILRFTEVETEAGYPRQEWATIETTHSYTFPLSQSELLRANQAGYQVSAKISLPVGTDVKREDRIKVGETTYEVTAITEMTKAFQSNVEVFVSRVE